MMNRLEEYRGRKWLVAVTLLAGVGVARLGAGDDVASEVLDPPTVASPEDKAPQPSEPEVMPSELQRIQRSLGGPIADQFPTLEALERETDKSSSPDAASDLSPSTPGVPELAPTDSPLRPTDGPATSSERSPDPLPPTAPRSLPTPAWNSPIANPPTTPNAAIYPGPRAFPDLASSQRRGAAALRDAAAGLDDSANRLEKFELYRQADALRSQAQRLRVDARVLLGHQEYSQPISNEPTPGEGGARPWEAPVIMEQRPDLPPKPRRFGMRVGPEAQEAEAPAYQPQ